MDEVPSWKQEVATSSPTVSTMRWLNIVWLLWTAFYLIPSVVAATLQPELGFTGWLLGWQPYEAALLLLAVTLMALSPLASLLDGLGVVRQGAIFALFGMICLGQAVSNPQATYPFVAWAMYSRPDIKPEYYDYVFYDSLGNRKSIRFAKLHPISSLFKRRFDNLSKYLDNLPSDDPQRAKTEAELIALTKRLYAVYCECHPHEPAIRFEVHRCTVPVRNYTGEACIAREQIIAWEVN